jgi:hypothetical protein
MALVFFGAAAPARAAALSDVQIQSIINLLNVFGADAATVTGVGVALHGGTPTGTATPISSSACSSLTYTLGVGSVDAKTAGQVSILQRFLGISPPTGYFGPLTLKAVEMWQSGHGVAVPGAAGYGTVGPKTRAAMGCAGGASAPPAPTPPAPTSPGVWYPAPTLPGTLDQDGATMGGTLTLSGATTATTTAVTVYVVPASYTGSPDQPSLASFVQPNTSRVTSATVSIMNGHWHAYFAADNRGFQFPNGAYRVFIFGGSTLVGYGTVTVTGSANPLLTCSLSGHTDSLGGPATLSWTSNNATYATGAIRDLSGSTTLDATHLPPIGTTTVGVIPGATYLYTFFGEGVTTSCKVVLLPVIVD